MIRSINHPSGSINGEPQRLGKFGPCLLDLLIHFSPSFQQTLTFLGIAKSLRRVEMKVNQFVQKT